MGEVSRRGVVTAAGAVLVTAACGTADPAKKAKVAKGADPSGVAAQPVSDDIAVDPPTQLKGALFSTDVLVYSQVTLDKSIIENTRRIKGVVGVEPISMGEFYVDEQVVTYAAVNPQTFWRYTQPGTAQTQAVWDRVAAGEMAARRSRRTTATSRSATSPRPSASTSVPTPRSSTRPRPSASTRS
jgi:hypothetical protein